MKDQRDRTVRCTVYCVKGGLIFEGILNLVPFDLSITSTETKYIKLNAKTQNIFCRLNENLTTFLYTLTGVTRKQKEKKKVFSLKCIQKSNVIKKRI